MKTYAFCPISDKKINERVARINAVFTVLILLTFGFTQNILLLIFLGIDFLLRATSWSKFSLIAVTSRTIVKYLPVGNYLINAGPKIFAARIGLLLTSLIVVLLTLKLGHAAFLLIGVLALFSLLEGAFGICVACIIYPYVYKIAYKLNYSGK
jgi:hypothetical protein